MEATWRGGMEDVQVCTTSPSGNGERFEPLVVLEFTASVNQAAVEWLLAKLQATKTEGGADLLVRTLYLQHSKVGRDRSVVTGCTVD